MNLWELLQLKIELAKAKRSERKVKKERQELKDALKDLESAEQSVKDYIKRTQEENRQERNGE